VVEGMQKDHSALRLDWKKTDGCVQDLARAKASNSVVERVAADVSAASKSCAEVAKTVSQVRDRADRAARLSTGLHNLVLSAFNVSGQALACLGQFSVRRGPPCLSCGQAMPVAGENPSSFVETPDLISAGMIRSLLEAMSGAMEHFLQGATSHSHTVHHLRAVETDDSGGSHASTAVLEAEQEHEWAKAQSARRDYKDVQRAAAARPSSARVRTSVTGAITPQTVGVIRGDANQSRPKSPAQSKALPSHRPRPASAGVSGRPTSAGASRTPVQSARGFMAARRAQAAR